MDTIDDYRRTRFEEYASAVGFGLGMVFLGYLTFEGLQNNQNTFYALFCGSLAIGCGSLAISSAEQGKVMSAKVSELERKVAKERNENLQL